MMRTVEVNEDPILVPEKATGNEIKRCAMNQGVPIEAHWQLLGHNCNGSRSVIGQIDTPWQSYFTAIDTYDNA